MRLFPRGSTHRAWRLLLATALIASGVQAQARCSIKFLELPIKMVGHRAIATVGINGTDVPLLVDTGAFFSMLTESTAAQLNLPLERLPPGMQIRGLVGTVEGARMTSVKQMKLLDGNLSDIEFTVGGNEIGNGAMGILGRNILGAMDMEYDLAHGMIRFVLPGDQCGDSNMAYWANDTPVSEIDLIRDRAQRTPALRTRLKVNGEDTTAMFDTGATTLLTLYAAHRANVKDSDMTPSGEAWGVGSGKVRRWTAAFDSVEIGNEKVLHNRLEVADYVMLDHDMLIGIDFFLSHHIYVSKRRSKMFFTYNGGAVFAMNKSEPPTAGASSADAGGDTLSADAHARRGAASLARGDLAGALADLDRACALAPDNAGYLAQRAEIHARQGDGAKSLADLDAALRLDPGQAEARVHRAWQRSYRKQPDLVRDDLSVLDQTLPAQSNLRAEVARLYANLRMHPQALAQWNLWIAAHPHDIGLERAHNGRCWARIALDIELDKALDDCDAAVDADPKSSQDRDARGWAYLRLGKLRKARDDFDGALALKPADPFSLYGRGLVHAALGEAPAAQADFAAARAAEPAIDARVRASSLPVAADAPAKAPMPGVAASAAVPGP